MRGKADQRAFVQVGVDNVRLIAKCHLQHLEAEQRIKGELVARGADLVVRAPGNGRGAFDRQTVPAPAIVIGYDLDLMAQPPERIRFFGDPNVAAILRKKGSGGHHDDP